MHSIYYAPSMGREDFMSHERLEALRSSAFESEHAWQYDTSYMEHEAAAVALEQEIERSLASISPDENSDEQIRIIKTQITIHRERQKALRPHLESGSGDFDGWGNECTFVPAPNQWGANGDLDEESETLSSIHKLLTWQSSSPISVTPPYSPLYDELPSPDVPYSSMLDPYQAPTTYHLHRTREWTGLSGSRKYVYTAREHSDKYAMYMLEAMHRGDNQITAADFFRAAEYPKTCIRILLSGIEKQRLSTSSKDAAYKSRCIHLDAKDAFAQSIREYPDRQQKIPWSPRRFTYGGRRFVWKSGDSKDDSMPETLYEFRKDWAKTGSRTGKRCDDAQATKLVWGEKKRSGKVDSYTIHFAGGMDQVFREVLLASQMARQTCLFTAMN
ncbi:hypothetical protein C7974DRAFT_391385 [Boeremia exigua]|uniref:uncharacterized protein n=1 Tax=Boeremia exigua TaxID=749465 RepID=UPI001E8E9761|nr:uncharacterized protein C7974DRAFT_391385 [Boeremia exigua]KAH6638342.1 hypothetical protein C7974DRAFT_391385 [Boeremia exigua]